MKLFTPDIHFDILDHNHMYWGDPDRQQEFERLWREFFNDLQHQDGTITVTPSILITDHENGKPTQVHGYLTKGVWKPC